MVERRYSKATEAAIFAMSLSCYYPGCPVPSVEIFGKGEARKNVQVAHIVAVTVGGPRWRADFPVHELNLFSNIILLCGRHHPEVDSKKNEKQYPEILLLRWKAEQERGLSEKIHGLSRLTESRLGEMLNAAVFSAKDEILGAIRTVRKISASTALVLEALVAKMERSRVDAEAASMLYDAAYMLGPLEDNALLLDATARSLGPLEENALLLHSAAQELGDFSNNVRIFTNAVGQLEELRYVHSRLVEVASDDSRLSSTADRFERALELANDGTEQAGQRLQAFHQSINAGLEQCVQLLYDWCPPERFVDSQRWRYGLGGFVLGVIAVLLCIIVLAARGAI